MPSLQELAKKEGSFSPGHRMCAGCTVPIFARMLSRVTDYNVVVGSATGCLEVASSVFPYSAWKVPWIHTAFENVASTMSGAETAYRALKKRGRTDKQIKFVAIGGDGGTYDIGLQALSGVMERGHDLLYICYDNGAYMNTGIQRSSATPPGAATTTTPVGTESSGKKQKRKDLTSIMVAHHLEYVAQASVHNPVDLSNKLKKGIELDGPAFLNILCPCIPGWRIAPDKAVASARQAVETRFWPLYEVEGGTYKINYKPKAEVPISAWLLPQGRFRHLKRPEHSHIPQELQQQVDEQWNWLLEQENGQ
jgi:pyruvate ferredoxin oxidoreductase beta subunit